MQGINISINNIGARLDVVLLSITGYIDTSSCQELAKVINDLADKDQIQIIADLGGVTYVSSAGWGAFMGEIKNIRDHGGDIKIVQMSQEVYEVFEMLEFDRILNFYDSIEEAVNEFDIIRGINITKVGAERQGIKKGVNPVINYKPLIANMFPHEKYMDVSASEHQLTLKNFPLNEKVKKIIVENPKLSIKQICKRLSSDEYGNEKINNFRMRSILKKMSLETRNKRYRFYRSR